jgi:hypothetical protein
MASLGDRALAICLAPSAAMAMTYIANAQSLALAMGNAVSAQQRGQVTAATATATVVAFIIKASQGG